MWIKRTIGEQRKILTALFEPTLLNLSKESVNSWADVEALDNLLKSYVATIPHCHLVYAIDKFGKQISSNISVDEIDVTSRGQDLSRRPYSVSLYPRRHFTLSSVYISQATGKPCISAVQPVIDEHHFLGFIVADFDIHHLPLAVTPVEASQTRQRDKRPFNLPKRVVSLLDQHMDDVIETLNKLIKEYGVFHCTVHCSSGQVALWHMDELYHYRLYGVEQLLSPDIYRAYPRRPYADQAKVTPKNVMQVLERFRALRLADDDFYLRAGSLNIMNAMVSLSFSSDGTEYMSVDLFLNKDLSFWLGKTVVNAN